MMRIYIRSIVLAALVAACQKPVPAVPEQPVEDNIRVLNSMQKLESYPQLPPSDEITLAMARGEAEHFQVVIDTEDRGSLSVTRSNPVEGISMSMKRIAAFEEADDALIEAGEQVSSRTDLFKIWFTYTTSATVAPGDYEDVLKLEGSAGTYSVKVKIKVYDVTIPRVPSIPAVMGINPPHISSKTGEAHIAERKEFSDALLDRRIIPFFCTWHANKVPMAVECISSPYPWNDQRTAAYMGDERMTHLFLPCQLVTKEEIGLMSGAMKTRYPEKPQIYYVRDEPLTTDDYTFIIDKAKAIHEANPEGKVITTFFRGPNDPDNRDFNDFLSVWDHLEGTTDYFCAGVWAFQYKEARAEQCRLKTGPGEQFWEYTAMGLRPGLTLANGTTPIDIHAVMWRVYKERAAGYLYWVANAFSSLSPLRSRSDLPKGDGILMYPGEAFNSDSPVISMRLERFRDGCEEYELMHMLEKKTSRDNVLSILGTVYKGPAAHAGEVSNNPEDVNKFKIKLMKELAK